jgi:RHS repeat-associated protein
VYFDQYNRVIRKEREGFSSESILVDTEYDDFGRVKRTSEPYFDEVGVTIYWNTPSYDALGRKVSMSTPNQDGGYDLTSQISYKGFTTEVTDGLGRKVIEVKNVNGQVIAMTDKASNDTFYEYDALGNLTKTTDSASNEVNLSYDIRSRKIEMNDPDMGIWKYKYNTFDQLFEQTDAKNQKTTMVYDALGRMVSRTDAFGTSNAKKSTWSYYTSPARSKGKLYQKTAANGDYTRYTYNSSYGQLVSTDQKIGTKVFTVKNNYDSIGRVSSITYPSTTAYSSGFKVVRQYNAKGFLSLVRKDDNSKTYWQADAISPRGQLEAATYGNGVQGLNAHSEANGWLIASQVYKGNTDLYDTTYEFDVVGNIKKRIDGLQNTMTEAFDYDNLDRLTGSSIYGGPSGVNRTAKSYAYDELGNITSKSDVGSYSYTGCGGRPHAVCNANGTAYTYDANGNMLTGIKGSTTTLIGYTAFNKSNYMQKGNYAVTFNYDAGRNRNYKSRIQSGSLNLQTYYVGTSGKGAKIFEQEVSSATGTKNIHYIYGSGGHAVATHITEGTVKRTEYFHRDHLGSVALVTNDAGQAVSPVSFDAWGKRRNTNWSDNSSGSGLLPITGNIGFTGQESITDIGLIHMNGRIYDPNLGRFLSADPLIQAPYNSQSYNRYSYVMNNPLSMIDPTGYSWISKKWKKGIKIAKNVIKNTSAWGRSNKVRRLTQAFVCTAYKAYCGAVAAGTAYYEGASTSDAIKVGVRAQAAAFVGEKIASSVGSSTDPGSAANIIGNGVAGGVSSEINGGSFKNGFIASATGATLKPLNFKLFNRADQSLQRVAFASIAGGAASYLSGGKVGEGMFSAAFTQYWNGEGGGRKFAGQCVSAGNRCKYEQKAIEDRPEGTNLGRKHCSYVCNVTYQDDDGNWAGYREIKIMGPGSAGSTLYAWNNSQKPHGTTQEVMRIDDTILTEIRPVSSGPFPVYSDLGSTDLNEAIRDEYK